MLQENWGNAGLSKDEQVFLIAGLIRALTTLMCIVTLPEREREKEKVFGVCFFEQR